jgi:phospholipid/cholesterol/gamma-HCH transport system substrate-binding protein
VKRSTAITWDQLKVGAMILVALLVMVVAVFKLGQSANLFTRRYKLISYLPTASGLRSGGQVTVAGKLVGSIKAIDLLPIDYDTTRNLRVVMELDRKVAPQVREDSRASIKTLGLLGDKLIDISPGTPNHRALRDGDTIAVAPTTDYEKVLGQASGAITEVVGLTRDVRKITGSVLRGEGTIGQMVTNRELYDNLNSTLRTTNRLMVRLENPNGTIGKLLDDPQLYQNLDSAVISANAMLRQISTGQGSVGKLLRDDSLYTHLVSVVSRMDSLSRTLAEGKGTIPKMFNDSQLYDSLVKTVTDLDSVLVEMRKDPRRYFKGMIKVF